MSFSNTNQTGLDNPNIVNKTYSIINHSEKDNQLKSYKSQESLFRALEKSGINAESNKIFNNQFLENNQINKKKIISGISSEKFIKAVNNYYRENKSVNSKKPTSLNKNLDLSFNKSTSNVKINNINVKKSTPIKISSIVNNLTNTKQSTVDLLTKVHRNKISSSVINKNINPNK